MRILSALTFIILFFGVMPAFALSSDWQGDNDTRVRLVSNLDAVGQEKELMLGLDVELGDNWHTYWRSPGIAGLPPQIDWTRSKTESGNLQNAQLLYPAPARYIAYNLETIGYRGHVLFPIKVALKNVGQPLAIDTDVSLLVCSSICVPKNYTLMLSIPAGDAKPSDEASLIQQYRDQIPGDGHQAGLLINKITNDGTGINVTIATPHVLQTPDIFIETNDELGFKTPEVTMTDDRHSAVLRVVTTDPLPADKTLAGMLATLTIVDNGMALERHLTLPSVGAEPPSVEAPSVALWVAVLFAIIGGFILNLMPCVLPVLSLKVLSVISHGGGTRSAVRRSFLTTAFGILASFVVLGGGTCLLRTLGHSFGWGVQFQQPGFLIFLIVLLTLFTANLWELIEISLPQLLADRVSDASYHPKLAGDFATGAFATLLATPCSAPFLGTAVGFALSSSVGMIMLIFSMLGLGMALPYILIALFPTIATALPKPGAWMITLRRLLGVALALTAIWLLWVLAAQITARYASIVGLSITAIMLLLGLVKHGWKHKSVWISIAAIVIFAIWLVVSGTLLPKHEAEVDTLWQPFSPNRLAADLAEGKTVFLDITADWCLTCKANKKFVLSDATLTERLFHTDVIAMQANWTNPDPVIADFLHKYGRYGIPFNAAFGPDAPQGIVLPELLTPKIVTNALDKASGKTSDKAAKSEQ